MDEMFKQALKVLNYDQVLHLMQQHQRLEAEREAVLKQKLLLELELAQVLAGQHPVT